MVLRKWSRVQLWAHERQRTRSENLIYYLVVDDSAESGDGDSCRAHAVWTLVIAIPIESLSGDVVVSQHLSGDW